MIAKFVSGNFVATASTNQIPSAALAVIPNSGHAINTEEPGEYTRIVGDFLAQVESEDPEIRFEAARAAGLLGSTDALPVLLQAARDDDAEVRHVAIGALGPMTSHYCRDPDGNLIEVATYSAPD